MASVLVIDDAVEVRMLLSRMLTLIGHEVSEAENGLHGLNAYKSAPTDIVLLDMFMPVMDGWETLRELLRHDPKARVIAMTGGGRYGQVDILKPALLMGACKMLHKPIELMLLQSAIDAAYGDDPANLSQNLLKPTSSFD